MLENVSVRRCHIAKPHSCPVKTVFVSENMSTGTECEFDGLPEITT